MSRSPRPTPESMGRELAGEWPDLDNPLEAWVGYAGDYRLFVGYSALFWPRFKRMDGYILRESVTPEDLRRWKANGDCSPRQIEATLNHIHLDDMHFNDRGATADKRHYLGETLKEIYEAKLQWQFPDHPCRVHLSAPDTPDEHWDYEITFWQKAFE